MDFKRILRSRASAPIAVCLMIFAPLCPPGVFAERRDARAQKQSPAFDVKVNCDGGDSAAETLDHPSLRLAFDSSSLKVKNYKPCEEEWTGTVEETIVGDWTRTDEIYDLGKRTETIKSEMKVSAKFASGAGTETVDYRSNSVSETVGQQFCSRNAKPPYAPYQEKTTGSRTGSGSGAASLSVHFNPQTNAFTVSVTPEFEYELTSAYKKQTLAACPGFDAKPDERNATEKSSATILTPEFTLDSGDPNSLVAEKTVKLMDDSTAVYRVSLRRCQSCEIKAKNANTNQPLSTNELKAHGFDASGGTQTIKTGAGERLEFTMADGSVIRVAPNSTLEFNPCDPGYEDESKKINVRLLLGKAWFHVLKAAGKDKDFDVQTERAIIGVRGTTFEVSYDVTTEVSTVNVIEGTVSFGDLNGEHTMAVTAGQAAKMEGDAAPTLFNSATKKPAVKREE